MKSDVPIEKSSTDQFDQLRLATLPNRFFAVVPAEQAEELAVQAEDAVRNEWQRLAEKVWERLQDELCKQVPISQRRSPSGIGSWRSFPKFTGRFTGGMRRHKRLPNSFGN
jgi:hypothetical protein